MPIESFKKLWVSCHLLYPNPSQARDIFGLIVDTGIDHSSSAYGQIYQGLNKLYRLYRRRDAVKSGSTNFEFTSTPLNYWKRVLQKCNKDETFIVMVALLELASVKDISRITKIPPNKVKYLFNQSVRKIISSPSLRFEQKKDIKFKEYNSQDVTTLFVSENLIEHVLGLATPAVSEKMEAKLKDNNRYNDYRNEILKFKAELSDLQVSHHFDEVMKVFGNTAQLQNLKKLELKQQKKIFVGLLILIVIVLGLILRPTFLKAPVSEASDKKVVLEEIAISKKEAPEGQEIREPIAATSPTATVSVPVVVSNKVVAVVSAPVVVKEKPPVVAAKITPTASVPVKLAQATGVYRGQITVTDFEQVAAIIRDRIIAIGGKKAGEVELGWIKNKNISYFHFIFPAEKREELVAFVQQYGKLSYKFEPHPRVLPIGQSRFIIEVHKGE
ncbi:hypothetical protein [Pseudobdellovibrio sp. HCB154]|uniref:hypothetical protein n=1 Tax=Pseudobdellovibrio sp. HCB154 TaxID=3386277 RepID=UPI003916D675